MLSYIALFLCIFFLTSCKDATDQTEVADGRLFTLNHGDYRTRIASDDWNTMNYGFDAVALSCDAYLSLEGNKKSNSFLLLGAPAGPNAPGITGYKVEAITNSALSLTRSSEFVIPDPSNPSGNINAVRYTVTSGTGYGSEKLLLYRRVQNMLLGTWHWIDLVTLASYDAIAWGGGTPDSYKKPLTMDAKIYTKTTLPTVYVRRLYGNTTDFSGSKVFLNKILSQAVCDLVGVTIDTDWPTADKSWDLDKDGKLDVWPDDPGNAGNEFPGLKDWALMNNLWSATKIGAVVLEQEFEVHGTGVLAGGMALENFIVLPKSTVNRTFCHEYLHCSAVNNGLEDLSDDEYNVMYYLYDFGYKWLRYRPFTKVLGGKEKQWDLLSNQVF
jgi:hypothetical protein